MAQTRNDAAIELLSRRARELVESINAQRARAEIATLSPAEVELVTAGVIVGGTAMLADRDEGARGASETASQASAKGTTGGEVVEALARAFSTFVGDVGYVEETLSASTAPFVRGQAVRLREARNRLIRSTAGSLAADLNLVSGTGAIQ